MTAGSVAQSRPGADQTSLLFIHTHLTVFPRQDRGYWDEDNAKLFPKTAAALQGLNGGCWWALVCPAILWACS